LKSSLSIGPLHPSWKNLAIAAPCVTWLDLTSSQVTNHQQCILHCAKSNCTVKKQNSSWLLCSWSPSGVSSRLVRLYIFFLSLSVHFVCSPRDKLDFP
jgi:hypothetical protein